MNLNVEPKEVFKWFYEINQIPRCSGDEKRISDFLVDFVKKRNLEVYQDAALDAANKITEYCPIRFRGNRSYDGFD